MFLKKHDAPRTVTCRTYRPGPENPHLRLSFRVSARSDRARRYYRTTRIAARPPGPKTRAPEPLWIPVFAEIKVWEGTDLTEASVDIVAVVSLV